jgi:hypothetical protein
MTSFVSVPEGAGKAIIVTRRAYRWFFFQVCGRWHGIIHVMAGPVPAIPMI